MYELKICKWCGEEFIAMRSNQSFCSEEHKKAYKYKNNTDRLTKQRKANRPKRICERCGKDITDLHHKVLYCDECKEALRENKKTGYCLMCGKELDKNNNKKKFCSEDCLRKFYRATGRYRGLYEKAEKPKKENQNSTLIKARPLTEEEKDICAKLMLTYGQIMTIREGFVKLDYYIKLKGWKYGV